MHGHTVTPRLRGRGVLIVFGTALLVAIGAIAFFAQRPPDIEVAPYRVARTSDISATPKQIQVALPAGSDRGLQFQNPSFGSCPGSLGCPGTTNPRFTPVFLVRDHEGVIHAFIGEDPKTGCALEWKVMNLQGGDWVIDGVRVDALFSDVCHGSLYDRRGKIAGGPSPWDLNQIAVEIRGEDVYVHPSQIIVGESRL